jgi:hypothetical protein
MRELLREINGIGVWRYLSRSAGWTDVSRTDEWSNLIGGLLIEVGLRTRGKRRDYQCTAEYLGTLKRYKI